MKYLEAKQLQGDPDSPEHKMLPGARDDQRTRSASSKSRPVVAPEVRQLADELGVELSTVTGTGKGGVLTKADVRRAAAAQDEQRLDNSGA